MSEKFKSVSKRFIKAFFSSAAASAATVVTIVYANTDTWPDFIQASAVLLLAATIGGVTGIIQAAQKYFSWTE